MLYNSILELIGNTPLVRLHKIEQELKTTNHIYAKLERQNPAGSIKDRAVYQMLIDLQNANKLHEGSTIIEPTSGNTGIALAALGNYFNYKIIIVMPSSMSEERKKLMRTYNAELILVEGGMSKAVEKAQELQKEIPDSLILGQFVNPSNPKAHLLNTGKEILTDLPQVDYLLAGIGTGGTISGLGEYFKKNSPHTKVCGIEPLESPLLTKHQTGKHLIQGIGADFIPDNYKACYVDQILDVESKKAINQARNIVKQEGYLVGISSGAALQGAIDLINNEHLENQNIVVIFPDTGERYSWN